jgi:hypothetical protein
MPSSRRALANCTGTSPLSKAERGKFLKRLEAIAAQSSG